MAIMAKLWGVGKQREGRRMENIWKVSPESCN